MKPSTIITRTLALTLFTLPLLSTRPLAAAPAAPAAAVDYAEKAKGTILKEDIQFQAVAPKEALDFISKHSGIPVVYTPAKEEPSITMYALPEPVTAADALQGVALLGNFTLTYEKDGAHLVQKDAKESKEPAADTDWTRVVDVKPFSNPQGTGVAVFIRYNLTKPATGIFAVPYVKDEGAHMPVLGSNPFKAGSGGCVRGFFFPGARANPIDEIHVVIGDDLKGATKYPFVFDGADPMKPVEDLSTIKTPGELLVYISKLRNRPILTEKALDENQKSLHLASADFQKRFADSPLRWDVLLDNDETSIQMAAAGKSDGFDAAKIEEELRKIAAAPDASDDTKDSANMDIVGIEVDKAPDDALEPIIASFHHDHPDSWDDNTLTALLRSRLRKIHDDDDKQVALLTPLTKSADKDVAAQAADLMLFATAKKRVADLQNAPLDLKFTAIDGSEVDISKLRGKVVLIDFWATWCKPCMIEAPHVVAAFKKYHDKGFEIIGISLDRKDDKDKVIQVAKTVGMDWPQYYDGKFWHNHFSASYGIEAIPAMWLVDKKGMVVNLQAGQDLESGIEKLLAE